MVGSNENVYVQNEYDNIVLIDPNKIVSGDGVVSDRLVKHEELVMYANLEASLLPRTRLAVSNDGNLQNTKVSIAKVNFLKPGNKTFLTNEYLDDMTGIDRSGRTPQNNQTNSGDYVAQDDGNYVDTELLLISQISIENNASGLPTVSIEMDDIRGRALFEKGENSPYAVFFNYPYPIFHLTVKGYYGQAIDYQLALRTFNARFDTQSGNFKISVKFLPYKYNVLTSIPVKYLLSVPFMYSTIYDINPSSDSKAKSSSTSAGNGSKGNVIQYATSKGRQKIHEVYSEYKAKNLIEQDFPEITLQELVARLENLENYIGQTFSDADLAPLTDAENYGKILSEYEKEVFLYQSESWFAKYLDKDNFYVDTNGNRIYTYSTQTRQSKIIEAVDDLKVSKIAKYNKDLSDNKTFGGTKSNEYHIPNNISYDMIYLSGFKLENIDIDKSFTERTGKLPTQDQEGYIKFRANLQTLFNSTTVVSNVVVYNWYFFEGNNSFETSIKDMRAALIKKTDEIQNKLIEKLSSRLENNKEGLGFKPLLINIIAVIMASSEAFLRLMCDVHDKAWEQRKNETRRSVVIDDSKCVKSVDAKDSVKTENGDLIPIYPWPQFFVQNNNTEGEPYTLEYPGDPRYTSITKGYRYDVWPEVEFVEEFLKARVLNQKNQKNTGPTLNTEQVINKISLNALDFPPSNIIFSNKQNVRFLYEIWERVFLYSNYQRLMKPDSENYIANLIAETEFLNIKNSLSEDSPDLIKTLKEFGFNSNNFITVMKSISLDGVGESWQKYIRDIFVTPYIQQEVESSFSILDNIVIQPGVTIVSPQPTQIDKLKEYLKTQKSNVFDFTDTTPFNTSGDWFKQNLANGDATSKNDLYNTTKTLVVNDDKKMIADFTPQTSVQEVRPITNFNYNSFDEPKPTLVNLKNFYKNRIGGNLKNQLPTEGGLVYHNYSGNVISTQTTSIMNTPYFVNSIQRGVNNWLTGGTFPYAQSAFLFINSLPLGTLREKYKTSNGTSTVDLDYIFATLKKFGAIHKMPYAWVLKYGSIWYRYKTWVNTGIDILQSAWTDFDAVKNFDPVTQNPNKSYSLTANGVSNIISLQSNYTNGVNTIAELNVGFYPKVINDLHVFYKGYDLFDSYTDSEIQSKLDNTSGITLTYNDSSSFQKSAGHNPLNANENLRFKTWSCLLNDNSKQIQYILPSFGGNLNQTLGECFNDSQTTLIQQVKSNPSVLNGSVRTFWSLPNYGYFDNTQVNIPSPSEYMKKIFSGQSQQESFSIRGDGGYINIEELFSVFDKKVLDILESEFLSFSKSMYDYTTSQSNLNTSVKTIINKLPIDSDSQNKNFQLLMKTLLSFNKITYSNSEEFNNQAATNQIKNSIGIIQKFLEYDVVLKYGNPSNFDRKLFDSYSTINNITDKITFNPYVNGTLPTSANTTATLSSYVALNPQAWADLQTYVGFSNQNRLKYTNTGSTITDFFIDMNIEFTSNSVKTLAPLIKIYATQKKLNPKYNKASFTKDINTYLTNNKKFSDNVFNSLFTQLQKSLPDITEQSKESKNTAVQGEVGKIQLWESFKALNDTWIAGYNYSQTTLLEDFLLVDRASRNIRNKIFIDPFIVRKFLSPDYYGEGTTLFGYVTNIIQAHGFNCAMMPAFMNYYNVQAVGDTPISESITDFGNSMFGTFMNVDTRRSSPKILCTYSSIPSQHNDMSKNKTNRFNDDTFNFDAPCTVPLKSTPKTEDLVNTNKVVAFNVDIGIRNQNIFYHFDVSQDIGKETVASLNQIDYMINEANGKNGATQNVSLWNFFRNRQYQSQIRCMGNVMIQPNMYFNLRHVPMFYGPYLITNVKHNITPGLFETTITGVRQSVFTFNIDVNYMQILTKQILTEITAKIKAEQEAKQTAEAEKNKVHTYDNTFEIDTSNNCSKYIPKLYDKYTPAQQSATTVSSKVMVDNIKKYIVGTTNDKICRLVSFVTIYLQSYNGKGFSCWNNNYCGAYVGINDYTSTVYKLDAFGGSLATYIEKQYLCEKGKDGESIPYSIFKNIESMMLFLKDRWYNNIKSVNETPDSIFGAWFVKWNTKGMPYDVYENYKINNSTEYKNSIQKVTDALELAKSLGL